MKFSKLFTLIFVFTLIILIFLVNNYNLKSDLDVCKSIHFNENGLDSYVKRYKVVKKIIDLNSCNQIIKEAETYAQKNSWSISRHKLYPTVDNLITLDWDCYKIINNFLPKLFKSLEILFNLKRGNLELKETFIVKYSMDLQKELEYHKDSSQFSFILGLNNSFSDGGTEFKDGSIKINLDIGDVLIFCGENVHRGFPISSGTRYILTGFINYKGHDFCSKLIKQI